MSWSDHPALYLLSLYTLMCGSQSAAGLLACVVHPTQAFSWICQLAGGVCLEPCCVYPSSFTYMCLHGACHPSYAALVSPALCSASQRVHIRTGSFLLVSVFAAMGASTCGSAHILCVCCRWLTALFC
jgi:hypothetical protein